MRRASAPPGAAGRPTGCPDSGRSVAGFGPVLGRVSLLVGSGARTARGARTEARRPAGSTRQDGHGVRGRAGSRPGGGRPGRAGGTTDSGRGGRARRVQEGTSMAEGMNEIDLNELLGILQAIRAGDLSARISGPAGGIGAEIARAVNGLAEELGGVTSEVGRIAREIGAEGKFGGQAHAPGAGG